MDQYVICCSHTQAHSHPRACHLRHQKCRTCCKQLKNLSNVAKSRASQVGRHGSTFRELQLLMSPLDDLL